MSADDDIPEVIANIELHCDDCADDDSDDNQIDYNARLADAVQGVADAKLAFQSSADEMYILARESLISERALLSGLISDISGSADIMIKATGAELIKHLQRMVNAAKKSLDNTSNELYSLGTSLPWSYGDKAALLELDQSDMVLSCVKPIRDWFERMYGIVPTFGEKGSVPIADPTLIQPAPDLGTLGHIYNLQQPSVLPSTLDNIDSPTETNPPYTANGGQSPEVIAEPSSEGKECKPCQLTVNLPPPLVTVYPQSMPTSASGMPTGSAPQSQPLKLQSPIATPTPLNAPQTLSMKQSPDSSLGEITQPISTSIPSVPESEMIPERELSPLSPTPLPPSPTPEQIGEIIRKLPPDTSPPKTISGSIWSQPSVCAVANARLSAATTIVPAGSSTPPGSTGNGDGILGTLWKGLTYPARLTFGTYEWLTSGFDSSQANKAYEEISRDLSLTAVGSAAIDYLLPTIDNDAVPNKAAAASLGTRLALAATAEARTGFPVTYLTTSDQYLFNYANPQYIPSQAELNGSFLANEIGISQWECLTRAHGNIPDLHRNTLNAQRTRPGIGELTNLLFRGVISREQYSARLREMGVINPNEANEFLAALTPLPSPSDLIMMMKRDAGVDSIARQYGYDEGFNDKYSGQIRAWARSVGLDDKVFLYLWRSHWMIPSNTALYEMYARLRPDRLEVREWEGRESRGELTAAESSGIGKPVVVTKDDIRNAMQVNDVAPGWVEPLLAISYQPITRTDALRAFLIGAFNEEQLRETFLNLRYSPRDADTLVSFYVAQKAQRNANTTGVLTTRRIAKLYKTGALTDVEAARELSRIIPNKGDVSDTLSRLKTEMVAESRARLIAATKRKFRYGEITRESADNALFLVMEDRERVSILLDQWEIDRDGTWKLPTVSMLTDWMRKRLITAQECLVRLTNLQYRKDDAEKIIAVAVMKGEASGDVTAEEVGGAFETAIRTARDARKAGKAALERRKSTLLTELSRVHKAINDILSDRGLPRAAPIIIE